MFRSLSTTFFPGQKYLRLLALAALALFVNALPARGGDWPQFRGPDGQGHAAAQGLPLAWSETQHVRWKCPIPGEGWSSPVIAGNRVWLTTALDNGKSLRAVCVDLESGKLIHDVEVFKIEKPALKHDMNSYASPSPIVEDGRLYAHFGTAGTACLSAATGEVLWRQQGLKLNHEAGPGSSPALWRDKLIIPCDGHDVQYVAALDKATGKPAWKTPRSFQGNKTPFPSWAFCTPLIIQVDGKDQAVVNGAHYVVAYDPETGRELWSLKHGCWSGVPRPLFSGGLVYLCTGFTKPRLLAIRPRGGGGAHHVQRRLGGQAQRADDPLAGARRPAFLHGQRRRNGHLPGCRDGAADLETAARRIVLRLAAGRGRADLLFRPRRPDDCPGGRRFL